MRKNIFSEIGWLLAAALCMTAVWAPPTFAGPPFKGTASGNDFIQCTIDSATGSFAETQSNYTVQGDCQVSHQNPDPKGGSTFPDMTEAFIWTAVGTYQPGKYNTGETISVRRPTSTQFTTPVIATFTSTMLCGQDPWLQPDGLSCGSVRYQQTGTLGTSQGDQMVQAYLTQTNPMVPRSSMLSAQQRAALVQQYQKQHLSSLNLQSKPTALPAQPPAAATAGPSNLAGANRVAFSTAPIIVAPTPNTHAVEGFYVKVTVAGSYTGTEGVYVQFTWVDTPATQNPHPYVNTWPITLKDLVNGIAVPSYITRGQYGRWQVRAQITSPTAGAWGSPVLFYLDKIIVPPLSPNRALSPAFK